MKLESSAQGDLPPSGKEEAADLQRIGVDRITAEYVANLVAKGRRPLDEFAAGSFSEDPDDPGHGGGETVLGGGLLHGPDEFDVEWMQVGRYDDEDDGAEGGGDENDSGQGLLVQAVVPAKYRKGADSSPPSKKICKVRM